MYSKTVEIINPLGLHARPATDFTRKAKQYESEVSIITKSGKNDGMIINAKSVLKIIAASITQGEQIEICADGNDEKEAVDHLAALVNSGFGEIK